MLRLSGAPGRNGDSIVYTGLRPGEKLHEELTAPGEETLPTAVAQVRLIKTQDNADFPLLAYLREIEEGSVGDDAAVIGWLLQLFPGLKADPLPDPREVEVRASVGSSRG